MNRWRNTIVALCAFGMLLSAASILGAGFGFAGIPREGFWGMQLNPAAPYTFVVASLDPGMAADRAGIRPGDVIDMRAQSDLLVRFWLLNEPIAGHAVDLKVLRNGRSFDATVVPVAINFSHRPDIYLFTFAVCWMLIFAALLAWRKPDAYDVRLLSLLLVCLAVSFELADFSATSTAFYIFSFLAHEVLTVVAVLLWMTYAGCFSRPLSAGRGAAQAFCVAASVVAIGFTFAAVYGEVTLQFSSEGYLHLYGGRTEAWFIPFHLAVAAAAVCSMMSIAASRGEERQRAIWALVPLTVLFAGFVITSWAVGSQISYEGLKFWISIRNLVIFIIPVALTYAALGRRLLDVGFVVNRALIFGTVSVVVIAAFILVEWAASDWLSTSSRTAGTIFSAFVALALGLSMRFIHKHVDRLVDEVFFRKRHEDEAALRRFGHEASYITDRDTLVRRTIAEVREHADAASVQILVPDGEARYVSAEGNGASFDENDRALVALRTWHKPVDLDTLETSVQGEFAFPMMSRGRLVGALVCGAKTDGEGYAPDESHALYELAHGVGMALDLLGEPRAENDGIALKLSDLSKRVDEMYALLVKRD